MKLKPLDILFSQYIRMRAMARVGGCERCLTLKCDIQKDNGDIFPDYKQLQCSHFIGRRRRSVRWDEDNAVGLCSGCHMHLSSHPLEHTQWFIEHLGEQQVDLLLARNRSRVKPDEKLLEIYFREKIKGIEK